MLRTPLQGLAALADLVTSEAERKKRTKYSSLIDSEYSDVFFQPIAIESLVAFGNDAWDFLKEL